MKPIQRWQGYVTDIDPATGVFTVALVDVDLGETYAKTVANVPISVVLDPTKLQLGTVIDWEIYADGEWNFTIKEDKWTEEEIAEAEAKAKELERQLREVADE